MRSRTTQPILFRGAVRNLGKPVALCKQYFDGGADEVVFLNITSFRQGVIEDLPMLKVRDNNTIVLPSSLLYSALLTYNPSTSHMYYSIFSQHSILL